MMSICSSHKIMIINRMQLKIIKNTIVKKLMCHFYIRKYSESDDNVLQYIVKYDSTKNVTFYHNTSNHIEYRVAVETIYRILYVQLLIL